MNNELIPAILDMGYTVLDPWTLTEQHLLEHVASMPYGEERRQAWRELNKTIGANNAAAIEQCHGVLAVLDGVDVDSGTAAEVGYATALRKPVLGYRGDFRLSADNEGSTVNLQVEYFIGLNGGRIVTLASDIAGALATVVPLNK